MPTSWPGSCWPTPQAIPAELAAEIADEIACDAPNNVERRDYATVEHAVWDDRHLIADVPVRIITDTSDESEPGNAEIQEGWFVLSPQVLQVIVSSGHDVPINEPEVVIAAILDVIDLAGAANQFDLVECRAPAELEGSDPAASGFRRAPLRHSKRPRRNSALSARAARSTRRSAHRWEVLNRPSSIVW